MSPTPDSSQEPSAALGADQLDELDTLLDDLRSRAEEIPQWEFCDGFLTALACTRRPVPVAEWLPMLLGDGGELDVAEGEPLPLLPAFADAAQQARFLELWTLRWNEVVSQLDADVQSLDEDDAFQPEAMDMRGAIASLPEEERADMEGQEIPSFGQVWALGFMFAVENWPEEWAAPRDRRGRRLAQRGAGRHRRADRGRHRQARGLHVFRRRPAQHQPGPRRGLRRSHLGHLRPAPSLEEHGSARRGRAPRRHARPQRPVQLRQRQEVQEVLRKLTTTP